jgi:hypothetical protein
VEFYTNLSSTLIYYLFTAGDCIDIAGIDHYPGTWSNQPYDHWDELDTLFSITDEYRKKAAVMELVFPPMSQSGIVKKTNSSLSTQHYQQ